MHVNQTLSILFYRKTKKLNKKGLLPLYCRVTIDGLEDEISTSCYIRRIGRAMHDHYKCIGRRPPLLICFVK